MSADNWTYCPRCLDKEARRLEAEKQRVLDSYGKVPADKYLADVAKLNSGSPEVECTFREDYELGVCEDGSFYVRYSGSCVECGLSHDFAHDEESIIHA